MAQAFQLADCPAGDGRLVPILVPQIGEGLPGFDDVVHYDHPWATAMAARLAPMRRARR